jgi:hypothetical protein
VLRLIRIALQAVLFFVLLSLMFALVDAHTGLAEKAVLVAGAAVVVWLALRVRHMGAPAHHA